MVEADGGSRGNPGPAAYGAVLRDAATGEVIAERAEVIGTATNNVAEYRGLIAGLELYLEHAEGAALEVRMDSKLVVEQMSGRWKIKHPDMKPLATAAGRLAPTGTTYTWIPRDRNVLADRLLNEALDAAAGRQSTGPAADRAAGAERPLSGWSLEQGPPTTLVLVRHGETDHTREKRFSGRGGDDPGLNADGRAQVRATAEWLAPLAGRGRRGGHLAAAPHPGDRRDPRRRARPPGGGRGGPRRGGVRHLGRPDVHRGARPAPRRPRGLAGRAGRRADRRRGVVRGPWTAACERPGTGCSRSTPGGPCSR